LERWLRMGIRLLLPGVGDSIEGFRMMEWVLGLELALVLGWEADQKVHGP
jgi:hypothetical protein